MAILEKRSGYSRSRQLGRRIAELIPGGVDSPFRAFDEVGGDMVILDRASGSYLFDVDGNQYIDYLGAWGPAILGHSHPAIVEACRKAIEKGAVLGASHETELELAELVVKMVPSVEKVRFVNSGTEAVMSALRLARGYSARELVIMMEGCYHGHSDAVLASRVHAASAGIPDAVAHNTIVVPFNNTDRLEQALKEYYGQIACVILEPVACSMGVIPPVPGYLAAVEKLCRKYDCLFVLDEVLTGFRVASGGAQSLYNVCPDLTCFGKSLGGGMPIGAYGGRAEIMNALQPGGSVYQAGTFSGNPVTMSAGIAVLKMLANSDVYQKLEDLSALLFTGLSAAGADCGLPLQLQRVGSLFCIMFAPAPVNNFIDAKTISSEQFKQFYHLLLDKGVYLPPSSVDAAVVSAAHTISDIEYTVEMCGQALKQMAWAVP